jgi:hypothetical protein
VQNQSAYSDILNGFFSDGDKRLIGDYLAMIRQLAGDDSEAARVAARLEEILGLGENTANAVDLSGASLRFEFEQVTATRTTIEINTGEQPVQEGEPLVLDLEGDGVELRSMEGGVEFDIDNDGQVERTGFVTGDDALLALDKNGNGRIDGVGELFGDKTRAKNGFEDLARMIPTAMGQSTGAIRFTPGSLFQDVNGDGRSSASELSSLASQGIVR